MIWTFLGGGVLSVLHALIPNHWLPILTISRSRNWTLGKTTRITLMAGSAHVLSTVLIGIVIGLTGQELSKNIDGFTHLISPTLLIILGSYFIYQHHRHHHFKIQTKGDSLSDNKIVVMLTTAMLFSPCIEIEGLFMTAGAHGVVYIFSLAILYSVITIIGMVGWIRLAYSHVFKLNWHSLEHNTGIITGSTLIVIGIISFFIH